MRYAEVWSQARLRAIRDLTPTIREFEIAPDGETPTGYPLGAHINVEVMAGGKPDTRSYSLTGADGCYRIAVKLDREGRGGSAYMWSLKPGALLRVSAPETNFPVDYGRPEYVLIAGGIGITPVRALVEHPGDDDVVVYRAIRDDELVLRSELDGIGVHVHYVVGDHAAPGGDRLLSPEHLVELVPDLGERDVYVCGPPGMTDAVVRNVRAAGVSRRRVHVERFAL